ncbi:glycerophosphodiester phosphodiesterase [candidate division KSB1 bacterium]|nr:glycerophosphodiester phosphodiesterase [candidate division KSB1 bacterium]
MIPIQNINRPDILITAHRGASGSAPENTLAAVKKAKTDGAHIVEIDVRLSQDLVPVLMHDATIDRTTNGHGPVNSFTFEQLEQFDAGSWFDKVFTGETIPTLQAVLDNFAGFLNIEIKADRHNRQMVERVVDVLSQNNIFDRCLISSFDLDIVESAKKMAPQIQTALICSRKMDDRAWDGDWHLCLQYKLVSDSLVQRAHVMNKSVHAWTVNEKHSMRKLIAMGVDGIMTNYPALLYRVLNLNKEE